MNNNIYLSLKEKRDITMLTLFLQIEKIFLEIIEITASFSDCHRKICKCVSETLVFRTVNHRAISGGLWGTSRPQDNMQIKSQNNRFETAAVLIISQCFYIILIEKISYYTFHVKS